MSDDAAFLAAIKAAPNDNTARLVYADWLDEHNRRGGEFLRIECALAVASRSDNQWWKLIAQLRGATTNLDEDWIAAVSRVPVEEILARVREIQSWLQRRVTVAEMLSRMADWDNPPQQRSLWSRMRDLFKRSTDSKRAGRWPARPRYARMDRNEHATGRRIVGVRYGRR
jgi:uncharacterized protein (TIGR02996 family)